MKYILVPTDFSQAAEDAYFFALELAPFFDASVRVVHVFSGSFNTSNPLVFSPNKGHQEVLTEWLKAFVELRDGKAASQPALADVPVDYEVELGLTENTLIRLSKEPDVLLLIMGATGKHQVGGKLFGSVSETVSRRARCPVLLVPRGAKFHGFDNIAFASDYQGASEPILDRLLNLAARFGSSIHFVHIQDKEQNGNYEELEKRIFDHLFRNDDPDFAFQLARVSEESISEGLQRYAAENEADLLVMVTWQRSFWQNLVHQSHTKEMALKTEIPLMVFHLGDS